MAGHTMSGEHRHTAAQRHHAQAVRMVLGMGGTLFVLLGAVLVIGGLFFKTNGAPFYLLAGLGLIVSGLLIAARLRAGAWTLLAVFAGTLSWSLRNIAGGGSSLAERLVGPSILLAMIALLLPLLDRWRARQAAAAFVILWGATIALGMSASPPRPLARPVATITQFLDLHIKGAVK